MQKGVAWCQGTSVSRVEKHSVIVGLGPLDPRDSKKALAGALRVPRDSQTKRCNLREW